MAIATKKICGGTLVLADAFTDGVSVLAFTPVSNSSDWFESHALTQAPRNASECTVTLAVNAIAFTGTGSPVAGEELWARLLESDDLVTWSVVGRLGFSQPVAGVGLFEAVHVYTGSPKKYFRLQFNVDDVNVTSPQAIPIPGTYTVRFDGTCWVTVTRGV